MGKRKRREDVGGSYGRLAKVGAVWVFFRQSISQVFSIPAGIILARLLSPTEFGIAAAAWFFVTMSNRLGTFGLNAAIVRMKELRPEHLSSVFVFNLATGALSFCALQLAAPLIGDFYRSPDVAEGLRIAALNFLIVPFGSVQMALLLRNLRFRDTSIVEWSFQVTQAVSAVLLAWYGHGFLSIIYSHLAANAVQVLTKVYLARWRPSLRFSVEAMREIVPFGAGVFAKRMLDFAAQNIDSLVVGRVLGVTALGFYDKAFNTADRLLQKLSVGPGVTFRIFALIQEDPARFRRAYRKVVLSITLLGYPAFMGLILVAPELIVVVFGPQWEGTVLPFQILCAAAALKLLNAYISAATQAQGFVWAEVWRQVAYAASIIGGIAAFSRWGVAGAAAAVLIATMLMAILMQMLIKRVASLSWGEIVGPQMPALIVSACLVPVVLGTEYLVQHTFGPVADWQLLMTTVASAGLFFGGFILLARFGGVDDLVDETLADLAPWLKPILRRRPGAVPPPVANVSAALPEASDT